MKKTVYKIFKKILLGTGAWAVIIASLFPIYWLVSISLKTRLDAFAFPPVWFFKPRFDNYLEIFREGTFFQVSKNSLIITTFVVLATLILSIPSGYGLARSKRKGAKVMGFWILMLRMAPGMGFILPLYIILVHLHLKGTYLGLIIVYLTITVPFATWFMMSYFSTIPLELEDAGLIDGCSKLQLLLRINLPMAIPGMATVAIFSFMWSWNEFLYALVISKTATRTAPVFIQQFMTFEGINWGPLCAAGTLVALPVLIFSFLVQKGLLGGFRPSVFK